MQWKARERETWANRSSMWQDDAWEGHLKTAPSLPYYTKERWYSRRNGGERKVSRVLSALAAPRGSASKEKG